MGRKNTGDGKKPPLLKKRTSNRDKTLSKYAEAQIPQGAVIDFVFYEDFNADGLKEAAIGITRFTPFPPDSAVLLIHRSVDGMVHNWLSASEGTSAAEHPGTHDNADVADMDADGRPELVLSLAHGQEHCTSVYIFDWNEDGVHLAWRSEKSFYHGSMEVNDIDGDGMPEIIVESGTQTGCEVISMKEASYHVRESCIYKWDGRDYTKHAYRVHMPYESYNLAVCFINALWAKDYGSAFEMVVMPGFLGLDGLDDSSMTAFKSYISRKVRPVLARNLSKGKLVPAEPYDTCCQFAGAEDYFVVELVRVNGVIKVYSLQITKRHISE